MNNEKKKRITQQHQIEATDKREEKSKSILYSYFGSTSAIHLSRRRHHHTPPTSSMVLEHAV
jgi:hypothetical protein